MLITSCHLTGETNFIRSSSSGAGGGFPGVALRCISSSWYAPKCLDAPERPSMWLTILWLTMEDLLWRPCVVGTLQWTQDSQRWALLFRVLEVVNGFIIGVLGCDLQRIVLRRLNQNSQVLWLCCAAANIKCVEVLAKEARTLTFAFAVWHPLTWSGKQSQKLKKHE